MRTTYVTAALRHLVLHPATKAVKTTTTSTTTNMAVGGSGVRPGIVYSVPAAQGIAFLYCSFVVWPGVGYVLLYESQAEALPKCRTGT